MKTLVQKISFALFSLFIVGQTLSPAKANAEELIVIVNQSNQVRDITIEKIKKMFSGQIRFWKNGKKISPYHLDKSTKEKGSFISAVFDQSLRAHGRYWLSQKQLSGETEPPSLDEDASMAWVISRNKYAIGYLARSSYEGLSQSLRDKIKPILRIQ